MLQKSQEQSSLKHLDSLHYSIKMEKTIFTVTERNAIRHMIDERQAPLLAALEDRVTKKIAALGKRVSELEQTETLQNEKT